MSADYSTKSEVKVVLLMDAISSCVGGPTSLTWYAREGIARGLLRAGWRAPKALKPTIKKAAKG